MVTDPATKTLILDAAKQALIESGYSSLSTRSIAQRAGVPLSQIHYHFGSKQNLVLEVLADDNHRLLERQTDLYESDTPLWEQWERACDYLDDDVASGYVRLLHEMMAAGWGDDEIAAAVRSNLTAWMGLLANTAKRVSDRIGGIGEFTPEEIGVLAGAPFIGVEAMILLGFDESDLPMRSALRKVGAVIRELEGA
ncbi:MAG TPA: TetR/AcrR family transcriptional regulator [Acidimicrobiia bacterium]|nr:TetR/AcrR family transcriptional regulator [Acidimicrobiia bacterium]